MREAEREFGVSGESQEPCAKQTLDVLVRAATDLDVAEGFGHLFL